MTRFRQPETLLLLAILIASTGALLVHIDRYPGLNGDEAWSAVHAQHLRETGLFVTTPSQRLVSSLYMLASALAQLVAPGSVVALRLPAVVSGVALVAIAALLFPRMVARGAAIGAIALVATAPMLLAYGRIGWDVCLTAPLGLVSFYFAWTARWSLAWAFFLLALSVHPTNIFLGPLLFVPQLWWLFDPVNRNVKRLAFTLALDLLGCVAAYYLSVGQGGRPAGGGYSPIEFVRDLLRYLYGATAFEYFTTTPTRFWLDVGDVVASILGTCAVVGLVIVAREDRSARRFIVGYAAMLLGVYFIGGRMVLSSAYSRFGVCLLVPSFFFAAVGWDRFAGLFGWKRPWLALSVACLLLVTFYFGFIRALDCDGSSAFKAYWTGAKEPKVAAYREAVRFLGENGRIHVEDHWTYWPLRYLDGERQPERVEWHQAQIDGAALARQVAAGDVVIGFAEGELDKALRPFATTLERVVWHAPSGKETVALWRARASGASAK